MRLSLCSISAARALPSFSTAAPGAAPYTLNPSCLKQSLCCSMSCWQASGPLSMMQPSRTVRVSGQAQQIFRGGEAAAEAVEEAEDETEEDTGDEGAEGVDVAGVSEVIEEVGMAGQCRCQRGPLLRAAAECEGWECDQARAAAVRAMSSGELRCCSGAV